MNAPESAFNNTTPELLLDEDFRALTAAYETERYPTWEVRKQRLKNTIAMLQKYRQEFLHAIKDDFGHRSLQESEMVEFFPSLEGLHHAIKHGKAWMKPRARSVSMYFTPASAQLMPQPLGVIGIIVPWNYPLYLAIGPLTAALTAGNRAYIKMSEYTPRLSDVLSRALDEFLGKGVVRVINGGPEMASAFTRLPFNHIVFTGSTPVGKHVMRAAAENLTPVTLELGGKSPCIITESTWKNDGRFFNAVVRTLAGKTLNAGQTCIAPDYVLVPRAAVNDFYTATKRHLDAKFPRGAASDDYTGIVSDRHYRRLQNALEEARLNGARVETLMGPARPDQRKLPLTLVSGASADSILEQEEIFGPVLPVVPYDSLDDAIAYINARPRPLALYLFDDKRSVQDHVMRQTIAGGVSINETLMHIAQDTLPFGGVGSSGMGHYHGEFGFESLSKLKPIFRQARFNAMFLLAPPYGKVFATMMKIMTR
jgi:acyl-CoA reductase-like NAD-dependent aldehyde dehydrogenase